jgi:hypothetical protein
VIRSRWLVCLGVHLEERVRLGVESITASACRATQGLNANELDKSKQAMQQLQWIANLGIFTSVNRVRVSYLFHWSRSAML